MNEAGKVVVRDDVGLAARWKLGGEDFEKGFRL